MEIAVTVNMKTYVMVVVTVVDSYVVQESLVGVREYCKNRRHANP